MREHETFQAHCRFCFAVFERDTMEEVLEAVKEHEAKRVDRKCEPVKRPK